MITNWDTTLQQCTTRTTTARLLKAPSTTTIYNVIPQKVRQLYLKPVNETRKKKWKTNIKNQRIIGQKIKELL